MSDRLPETHRLLEKRVRERTRELETMLEVSHYLASTLELDELLPLIFEQLKRVVEFTGASVSLIESDGTFLLVSQLLPESHAFPLQRLHLASGEGWLEENLAELREPIIIPDLLADTVEAANWRKKATRTGRAVAGIRTWMAVPLIAGKRTIGLLTLEHEEPHFYTPHHARLALALANHIAVAIENARLFELEQRRTEQLRAIADVSHEISSYLAVDTLANQAAYLIQQAFGYYHVHIGLIEGEAVVFRPTAGVWRNERVCHYCDKHRFLVGQVGAAGRVAATGEPILVPDVQQDPRYLPMDDRQTGSALVLPLTVRGQTIGVLNIESDDVNRFSPLDAGALQSLANQLAVALENARLYEQAQTLATLQERQRLARELHDSVSQALYGIGLGTQTALTLLHSDTAEKQDLLPPLTYTHSLATTALAEMRALIFELRPESLEVEGLIPSLARRLEALRTRHELQVEAKLEIEPELPLAAKEGLYRVTQEALHNVVKHAHASHVNVSLTGKNGNIILEVRDDGQGFDPQGTYPGHLGLHSMRERVHTLGGHLTIESTPGQGATVRVVLNTTGSAPAPST